MKQKDALPTRSIILVIIGILSAVIVFFGSSSSTTSSENSSSDSRLGCILSFVASIAFASLMLNYRSAGKNIPEVDMLPATIFGSLLSSLFTIIVTAGTALTDVPGDFENLALLFIDGGVIVGIALMGYTIGPKMITAAEVTLICLLEPCLAPVFVWLGVNQVPSLLSIVTGFVFIAALIAHEVVGMRVDAVKQQHQTKEVCARREEDDDTL